MSKEETGRMSGMAGLGATEDKAILVGGGFGALAAAVALDRVTSPA